MVYPVEERGIHKLLLAGFVLSASTTVFLLGLYGWKVSYDFVWTNQSIRSAEKLEGKALAYEKARKLMFKYPDYSNKFYNGSAEAANWYLKSCGG